MDYATKPEELFTKTETEIIRLICNDHTSNEIADKLKLDMFAVEAHFKMIIKKTNSTGIVGG